MLFRTGFVGRQFPSGVGVSGPPLLDFDFTKGVLPDSRMTFTRASSATYFDVNGVMQTAGNNVPRFDYDPVTHEALGYLSEGASTNLLLNSATLSTQSPTVAAAAHTLSFYGTGTITLSGASTAGPLVGTGANTRVSLTFTPTAGALTCTVTGSVTNAQLEQFGFATSYIPTTGAPATRAADLLAIPFTFPTIFSMAAEWAYEGVTSTEQRVVGTNIGQTPLFAGNNGLGAGIFDGGAVVRTVNGVLYPRIYNKAASAYTQNTTARVALNGGAVQSYTPSGSYAACTALDFLSGGASPTFGWLKRVRYWPRMLSDGELQSLGADPTLDVGFIDLPGGLDPRISFTRASTGTYTDIDKLMKTANSGVPRFDHDPITGTPLGLLVEEARTNLLFPSGDMFGLFGNPAGGTFSSSSQLAPNNIETMSRLSPNSAPTGHYTQKVLTVTASATYAFSIYAKAQELVYLQLYYDDGSANGCYVTFDVLNGVVSGPVTSRGTGTGVAATIQPVGNGLYRCTLVGIAGSATAARCGVILVTGPNPGFAPAFVGDPSTGLLLWGAQIEQGAFSTSYIPTVGSGVTRAIDVCDMPSALLLNQQAGTLSIEFTTSKASGVVYGGMCASTGFSDTLYFASTSVTATLSAGGGATAGLPVVAANVPHKVAASYTTTRLIGCLDGALGTPAALAAASFPYTTRFRFGDAPWSPGGNNINGYVRRARYWPRALSDAELQAATR